MRDASPAKLKIPVPSRKKGRCSARNVSKAVRLSCAGSASTWPKSGLTVASSVRLEVSPYFRSPPMVCFCALPKPLDWGTVTFFGDDVGRNLQAVRRAEPAKSGELAELGRDAAHRSAKERPAVTLGGTHDISNDHQAERVLSSPLGNGSGSAESGTPPSIRASRSASPHPRRHPT